MNERLLQYIWQFQYFNKSDVTVTSGETLEIEYQGLLNVNQGPDFLNARIKIGSTTLVGSIELHLKASQWFDHGHQDDSNYNNTILHVVFENDLEDEFPIPTLVLQNRISRLLLSKYRDLMNTGSFIPCAGTISIINELTWTAWKDRLLAERLTRKSTIVFQFLNENKNHWEESFWWLLARNFGIRVNADAFEAVARSIPINVLAKHRNQIHQLEALLLGQAGLLEKEFIEDYAALLQKEYYFLKKKYNFSPIVIPVHFLRMRPGNFPTIRLAQLAMLVHNSIHLFSFILEATELKSVLTKLDVIANDYWKYHYIPDQPSTFRDKKLGKEMIHNLVINTIAPIIFAYGIYHKEERYKEKAIVWLEQLKAERNIIIKGFQKLKVVAKTSFDSQALIELKTRYCDSRHCLQCAIGNKLLKNN